MTKKLTLLQVDLQESFESNCICTIDYSRLVVISPTHAYRAGSSGLLKKMFVQTQSNPHKKYFEQGLVLKHLH